VDGLPETDNRIQFQDLLMFAFTFGAYQAGTPAPELLAADVPGSAPELRVGIERLGADRFRARLMLAGNPGTLKGVHAILAHPEAEVESVTRGALLAAQAGEIFFTTFLRRRWRGARARSGDPHGDPRREDRDPWTGEIATIASAAMRRASAHADLGISPIASAIRRRRRRSWSRSSAAGGN
jgi:hypothetical protein